MHIYIADSHCCTAEPQHGTAIIHQLKEKPEDYLVMQSSLGSPGFSLGRPFPGWAACHHLPHFQEPAGLMDHEDPESTFNTHVTQSREGELLCWVVESGFRTTPPDLKDALKLMRLCLIRRNETKLRSKKTKYIRSSQTLACVLSPACSSFCKIRFYWNTATFICSHGYMLQ